MLGEELASDALLRRLVGQCFCAVLTEFENLSMVGISPRAALAVEAIPLVYPGEGLRRSDRTHFSEAELERLQNGGNSRRSHVRLGDPRAGDLFGVQSPASDRVARCVPYGSRFAASRFGLSGRVLASIRFETLCWVCRVFAAHVGRVALPTLAGSKSPRLRSYLLHSAIRTLPQNA